MGRRIDDIDEHILYLLAENARHTTAPKIAEGVDVTPATIRNRIRQLEDRGILRGYHADIDYERTGASFETQFACTAPVSDRNRLAQEALQISGVVGIRELMAGRENVVVTAVGTDRSDISRIAQELSALGLELEREDLVQRTVTRPYKPFSPENGHGTRALADFQILSGGAEVVEFTTTERTPIAGMTLRDANEAGILDDDILIISIERGEATFTPTGDTTVEPGDVVTLFSRESIPAETLDAFEEETAETDQ